MIESALDKHLGLLHPDKGIEALHWLGQGIK